MRRFASCAASAGRQPVKQPRLLGIKNFAWRAVIRTTGPTVTSRFVVAGKAGSQYSGASTGRS
jgi:hypothetical protein